MIGAGASFEADLPTGEDLKKTISQKLNIETDTFGKIERGDRLINQAMITHCKSQNSGEWDYSNLLNVCSRICLAMPLAESIDNYIHDHKNNPQIELMGKLGIVRSILEAESKSKYFITGRDRINPPNFELLGNTWFNKFFKLLKKECSKDQLPNRLGAITLIIFNYDRCVEFYLYHALQTYYDNLLPGEAAELVNNMEIYHPYGTVGQLPWQQLPPYLDFGHTPSRDQLLDLAKGIKTFTEGTDPKSDQIKSIRNAMEYTGVVVFLGFGFLDLNLDLLTPFEQTREHKRSEGVRTFATVLNISESNREMIQHKLTTKCLLPHDSILLVGRAVRCTDFFDEYELTLARALIE